MYVYIYYIRAHTYVHQGHRKQSYSNMATKWHVECPKNALPFINIHKGICRFSM